MSKLKTICVCGAGTMGSGIAQVVAMAGFDTIQYDVQTAVLAMSKLAIQKNLEGYVLKGKMDTAEQKAILARIHFTSQIQDCKADICIEAIVENLAAKTALFIQLAAINTTATVFATNTSALSIMSLAAAIPSPSRIVGLHFFNPAPIMKLVEVVKAIQTDSTVVEDMVSFVKVLGKTSVVCKDGPGFIVNRVARQYYLEALKLVESGLATIETIDVIMEASGFKMGPFRLMDLIGIDINYTVSNSIWEALDKPERLRPSLLQKLKQQAGALGRKTGKGFYVYTCVGDTVC